MPLKLVTLVTPVTINEMLQLSNLDQFERGYFVTSGFVTLRDKIKVSQAVTERNKYLVTAKNKLISYKQMTYTTVTDVTDVTRRKVML